MAVLAFEGFDHLNNAQYVLKPNRYISNNNSTVTVAGRYGGYAMDLYQIMQVGLTFSSSTSMVIGWAEYWDRMIDTSGQGGDNEKWMALRTGGGANVVYMHTNGSGTPMKLYNGSGTLLCTGTTNVYTGIWYYFEVKVVVSASVGYVELRVNGDSVAEASASNLNLGSTAITTVRFAGANQWYNYPHTLIDDVYVIDTTGSAPTNDFLGDCYVNTIFPTSNGTNATWTPSANSLYQNVDEAQAHDGDSTYNSTQTLNNVDTFNMNDLYTGIGTVYAIQTNLIARKDGPGTRKVAPVIREGGTDYVGTQTSALGTSYLPYTQTYQLDPTGSAWTADSVNAAEFGYKVTT